MTYFLSNILDLSWQWPPQGEVLPEPNKPNTQFQRSVSEATRPRPCLANILVLEVKFLPGFFGLRKPCHYHLIKKDVSIWIIWNFSHFRSWVLFFNTLKFWTPLCPPESKGPVREKNSSSMFNTETLCSPHKTAMPIVFTKLFFFLQNAHKTYHL